jgi:hypothetical protein
MDCMGSPTTKQVRPFALGPGGDEAGEQLVLAAAGVLKLVDQQVADAVGDGQRRVGGQAVFASEHALGDLRDLGEVHGAGLGKGDLQLARRLAQQREAGLHDLPFVFGVAGGGQMRERRPGRLRGRDGGQRGDQIEDAAFSRACGRQESPAAYRPACGRRHRR